MFGNNHGAGHYDERTAHTGRTEALYSLVNGCKMLIYNRFFLAGRLFTVSAFVCLLCTIGCGGLPSPASWSEAEIESNIKEKMGLDAIDVTPSADGYSGTGKASDGETFSLSIRQDAAAKKLQYTATGDRGTIEEGFFEVD